MTAELNAGWETASSVHSLWRRLLCASTPPSQPLLHNTQRLRLTRTYQVISGQADLSLSSLFPGPFFWKHSALTASLHFSLSVLYVFSCLPLLPFYFSSFISPTVLHLPVFCPHLEAWEVCLEGVMCAESDPGDHQPPGSGHPLAAANSFIPAQRWHLPLGLSISDAPFSWRASACYSLGFRFMFLSLQNTRSVRRRQSAAGDTVVADIQNQRVEL